MLNCLTQVIHNYRAVRFCKNHTGGFTMKQKSALVLGSTGLVGGLLLDKLLSGKDYDSVSILVRREIPIHYPGLQQHVVDFDKLKDRPELFKADHVFCCLGTTIKKAKTKEAFRKVDYEYPVMAAEMALKKGAQKFMIITALGANPKSKIFYNRVKGEVESSVSKMPFEAVHIFRPSLLLGERQEKRAGEKTGIAFYNLLSPLFIGPLKKYRGISAEAVALVMKDRAKSNDQGVCIHESSEIQLLYNQHIL